jgi:hypothetical protein
LWHLGVVREGRFAYWRFLAHALVAHPKAFGWAVTLAINGYHFRTVAEKL